MRVEKTGMRKAAPMAALLIALGLIVGLGIWCRNSGSPPWTSPAPGTPQVAAPSATTSPAVLSTASPTPGPTPAPLSGVTAIAAGGWHTCALVGDGSVYCWGENLSSELGDGSAVDFSVRPVKVAGVTGATAIAAGYSHACAIVSNGKVRCWGSNEAGQLGGGNPDDDQALVPGLSEVTAIAAGGSSTCALLAGGTVQCWGVYQQPIDLDGVLIGTRPRKIKGITGATAIATGPGQGCALLSDLTVSCWGLNYLGELGTGTQAELSWLPVKAKGLSPARAIAMPDMPCAILTSGLLRCQTDYEIHALPEILTDVQSLAAGDDDLCVLHSNATVECWNTSTVDAPALVPDIDGAVAISAGSLHACALIDDGTVECWAFTDLPGIPGATLGSDESTPVGWPRQVIAPAS